MMQDDFGDRMKMYEGAYCTTFVPKDLPMCVRIDGKRFSKYTKDFKKPFDDDMRKVMLETVKFLMEHTHADFGYTQSDEITLLFFPKSKEGSEYMFGGKVSKINSVFASMATAAFNKEMMKVRPDIDRLALFDCRAWSVPSDIEASNVLLWRVQDARKNSISALFRWTAGHKAMNGLNQKQMKDYLLEHCKVSWEEDVPTYYKYGTYIKPVKREVFVDDFNKAIRTFIEEINVGYLGDYSSKERVKFVKPEEEL